MFLGQIGDSYVIYHAVYGISQLFPYLHGFAGIIAYIPPDPWRAGSRPVLRACF